MQCLEVIPAKSSRFFLFVAGVLLLLVVVLSFLPAEWKVALHTRGPWHAYGHLYLFTTLTACISAGRQGLRSRSLLVVALAALGFWIEMVQARDVLAAVEWNDVFCDALGAAAGGLGAAWRSLAAGTRDEEAVNPVLLQG